MKISLNILSIMLTLILTSNVFAKAPPRIIVYKGDPITITLGVKSGEQRVTFPESKVVWGKIKQKLKGKITQLIVDNNVYWTAKEPFKKERFIIGEEGGTKIYLVDVSAVEQRVTNTRIIVKEGEDAYAISDKDRKHIPETVISPLKRKQGPVAGFVTLFRCAAKQVYAPDRLVKCPVGIHKEFINTRPIAHLLRYSQTTTQPVAAWRSGGVYITAVKVNNITSQSINLDPRLLRGQWKSAFFMHPRLSPKGFKRDSTTLFLISKQPFVDVIASHSMITTRR